MAQRSTGTERSRGRILVVEDEAAIRELVRLHLSLAHFDVDEAGDGGEAMTLAKIASYALIILDVMLPGIDGVTVCRVLRRGGPNKDTPILMLTARDGESDKVLGLESGADDYVTKPFGVRELLARVEALLRRAARSTSDTERVAGQVRGRNVVLDPERRSTTVRGEAVELTRQEFDLLYQLASRPGIVFSRAALLKHVWNDDAYVTERTVDAVISRLRRKIERDPQDSELILTAWGVGYKFV